MRPQEKNPHKKKKKKSTKGVKNQYMNRLLTYLIRQNRYGERGDLGIAGKSMRELEDITAKVFKSTRTTVRRVHQNATKKRRKRKRKRVSI